MRFVGIYIRILDYWEMFNGTVWDSVKSTGK